MGRRGDIVRALLAGIEAGRNTAPVNSCPHPRGDLRHSAWLRGRAKGRTAPTGLDLDRFDDPSSVTGS